MKSSISKVFSVLILVASQLFVGDGSNDVTLNQIYGNIGSSLNDLKRAYPYYFKSIDSEPSQVEKTCESILRLLSKDETKLLSITDFAANKTYFIPNERRCGKLKILVCL